VQSLADAAEQGIFTQDQGTFDQAVADAQAAYQAGPADQGATTVPDFSQDPAVVAAVASAGAAYDAATQQADTTLTQQVQALSDTLQGAYDSATGTYNNAIAADAATETANDTQAGQVYNAALSGDQQTHDSAVAQAWSTYDQAAQGAQQVYEAAGTQSGLDRQAAEQAADDTYVAQIGAFWDSFTQAQQQATDTYNSADQAATDTYNGAISLAKSTYDSDVAQLDQTFQQQQTQAQADFTNAQTQALDQRTADFAAAQAVYDGLQQTAQQNITTARQAAAQQQLATTSVIDQQYDAAKLAAKNALKTDVRAALSHYDDAQRRASQLFWDFIDNIYNPGTKAAAGNQAVIDQLNAQKAQIQKQVALVRDGAAIALATELGDAQINNQPAINAYEKAKFDGYANAQAAYNNALAAANLAYDQFLAQPAADLQAAKGRAQQTYLNSMADAATAQADALANAEQQYDQGMTTAKNVLADALAGADLTLADTMDAATQARDNAVADAQMQLDNNLADAEQSWKDAREAAGTAEERTNAGAYSTYLSAITAAGVVLDDGVAAAEVAWDEADASAGLAWTNTTVQGWQVHQLTDAGALTQWYNVTTAADGVYLEGMRANLEAWFFTVSSDWQAEADSLLLAYGEAVHVWAQGAGTNFAQLIDVETSAWVNGETDVAAAAITNDVTDFKAQVDQGVQQTENDDTALNNEMNDLPSNVQTEAGAAANEAESESQAEANTQTSEDQAWQSDQHAAVEDAAARDGEVTAAAVANANADQDAQDAWEHAESQAGHDDQQAVSAADEQSAHAQADATRVANDAIANAKFTQEEQDAGAAQIRDQQVADAHHQMVFDEAQAADNTVHQGTDQAQQQVIQAANAAAAMVGPDVAVRGADYQAKNAAQVAQQIADHDAGMADLLANLPAQKNAKVQAANQQFTQDNAQPASAFSQVNPAPNPSAFQVFADYMPSYKTIVMVGGGVILTLAVPGAGAVLLAVAGAALVDCAADRYNSNQTLTQMGLGAAADVTGLTTLVAGITNKDLVTGNHLDLTPAQQRQMVTEGTFQCGFTVYAAGQITRTYLRGRQPGATKPAVEQAKPAAGAKPGVPEAAVPAKQTTGSNAGRAGQAEKGPLDCITDEEVINAIKSVPTHYAKKIPKPGATGKKGATDKPSWVKERPNVGESGKDFAKRLMDEKYGEGNYETGPTSEFNQIKKWADRHFMNP